MTQHAELIERLRICAGDPMSLDWSYVDKKTTTAAADAIEALERENAELRERLAATAKSAFVAMPHDIPTRMKRQICVNAGWSGSLASRAYIEIRNALTGEAYKADEDLDAARAEINGLRKDAERYRWLRHGDTDLLAPFHVDGSLPEGEAFDAAVDAAIQHEGANDARS